MKKLLVIILAALAVIVVVSLGTRIQAIQRGAGDGGSAAAAELIAPLAAPGTCLALAARAARGLPRT